jgi:hypothetical protein
MNLSKFLKLKAKYSKYLLTNTFMQKFPQEIWNRIKQGFAFPFEGWLSENEYTKPVAQEENRVYTCVC